MRWLRDIDPRTSMIFMGLTFMILGQVNQWINRNGLAAGLTVVGGMFMLTAMTITTLRILKLQDELKALYEKS